jgi:hypothetical protein
MQALRAALDGTRANSSAEKFTFTHQQVRRASPVALAVSMAQRLGWPHKGQAQGSMAAACREGMVKV